MYSVLHEFIGATEELCCYDDDRSGTISNLNRQSVRRGILQIFVLAYLSILLLGQIHEYPSSWMFDLKKT